MNKSKSGGKGLLRLQFHITVSSLREVRTGTQGRNPDVYRKRKMDIGSRKPYLKQEESMPGKC